MPPAVVFSMILFNSDVFSPIKYMANGFSLVCWKTQKSQVYLVAVQEQYKKNKHKFISE